MIEIWLAYRNVAHFGRYRALCCTKYQLVCGRAKNVATFLFLLNECDVTIVVAYLYMVELEGVVNELHSSFQNQTGNDQGAASTSHSPSAD